MCCFDHFWPLNRACHQCLVAWYSSDGLKREQNNKNEYRAHIPCIVINIKHIYVLLCFTVYLKESAAVYEVHLQQQEVVLSG